MTKEREDKLWISSVIKDGAKIRSVPETGDTAANGRSFVSELCELLTYFYDELDFSLIVY